MNHPRLFRILWASQSLSNLADALYLLAIVTMVYKLTGSALFAALVPLCRVAGQLICGVLAPLIMDRFPLTGLIKLSQLLQVILFAILAAVSLHMNTEKIPFILVIIGLLSLTDGITTPVRNSLIPMYSGPNQLLRANGIMSTTDQTVMMVGWAAGGVLVAWIGSQALLGWTLVMYAGALLLTLQLSGGGRKGSLGFQRREQPRSIRRIRWTIRCILPRCQKQRLVIDQGRLANDMA